MRRVLLAVVAVALVVSVVGVVTRRPAPAPAEAAARRFLATYVEADGRVVRHDQGGDTVSEGQAYALLLAVALGDQELFERVWTWTAEHLQRPGGLLSWHWAGGEVRDPEPAADADVDTAHALLLAADRFDEPRYLSEGLRIISAVREEETVEVGGQPVLTAGPWATRGRVTINPSYLHPRAFAAFAEASGERWWEDMTVSSQRLVASLLDGEAVLPPDWAVVERGGAVRPAAAPGQDGAPARYSLDAARVPIRFAFACDDRSRELAASLWPTFEDRAAADIRLAHDLNGAPLSGERHPVTLVAAAALADAAGDHRARTRLLDDAEALDAATPTYYGAAWVALGRTMLTTARLGGCP